ncbi:hypothetical protein ADUPG1_006844 [Aduncisulcus paluster]|uniref:Uncharacterized protein n=1 Tax=Aduncisulcus paluster TaxID=2918883 RepID=A0ABQ5KPD7_9EUKA|nr:hypothetical protein ADUPG1_006844 [Aduncisulcus paluster]
MVERDGKILLKKRRRRSDRVKSSSSSTAGSKSKSKSRRSSNNKHDYPPSPTYDAFTGASRVLAAESIDFSSPQGDRRCTTMDIRVDSPVSPGTPGLDLTPFSPDNSSVGPSPFSSPIPPSIELLPDDLVLRDSLEPIKISPTNSPFTTPSSSCNALSSLVQVTSIPPKEKEDHDGSVATVSHAIVTRDDVPCVVPLFTSPPKVPSNVFSNALSLCLYILQVCTLSVSDAVRLPRDRGMLLYTLHLLSRLFGMGGVQEGIVGRRKRLMSQSHRSHGHSSSWNNQTEYEHIKKSVDSVLNSSSYLPSSKSSKHSSVTSQRVSDIVSFYSPMTLLTLMEPALIAAGGLNSVANTVASICCALSSHRQAKDCLIQALNALRSLLLCGASVDEVLKNGLLSCCRCVVGKGQNLETLKFVSVFEGVFLSKKNLLTLLSPLSPLFTVLLSYLHAMCTVEDAPFNAMLHYRNFAPLLLLSRVLRYKDFAKVLIMKHDIINMLFAACRGNGLYHHPTDNTDLWSALSLCIHTLLGHSFALKIFIRERYAAGLVRDLLSVHPHHLIQVPSACSFVWLLIDVVTMPDILDSLRKEDCVCLLELICSILMIGNSLVDMDDKWKEEASQMRKSYYKSMTEEMSCEYYSSQDTSLPALPRSFGHSPLWMDICTRLVQHIHSNVQYIDMFGLVLFKMLKLSLRRSKQGTMDVFRYVQFGSMPDALISGSKFSKEHKSHRSQQQCGGVSSNTSYSGSSSIIPRKSDEFIYGGVTSAPSTSRLPAFASLLPLSSYAPSSLTCDYVNECVTSVRERERLEREREEWQMEKEREWERQKEREQEVETPSIEKSFEAVDIQNSPSPSPFIPRSPDKSSSKDKVNISQSSSFVAAKDDHTTKEKETQHESSMPKLEERAISLSPTKSPSSTQASLISLSSVVTKLRGGGMMLGIWDRLKEEKKMRRSIASKQADLHQKQCSSCGSTDASMIPQQYEWRQPSGHPSSYGYQSPRLPSSLHHQIPITPSMSTNPLRSSLTNISSSLPLCSSSSRVHLSSAFMTSLPLPPVHEIAEMLWRLSLASPSFMGRLCTSSWKNVLYKIGRDYGSGSFSRYSRNRSSSRTGKNGSKSSRKFNIVERQRWILVRERWMIERERRGEGLDGVKKTKSGTWEKWKLFELLYHRGRTEWMGSIV